MKPSMKLSIKMPNTAGLCLTIFLIILAPCFCQEVIDRIIAKVDESIITLNELNVRLSHDNNYKNIYSPSEKEEYKKLVLDIMIIDTLLLKEAENKEITINDKILNRQLMELYDAKSLDELKGIMKELNVDFEEAREWITKSLKVEKLLSMEVYSKNEITQSELEKYSDNKKENIEVHARQILLKVPDKNDQETVQKIFEKATMIRERLSKGEDFIDLSIQYSDAQNKDEGGDIGFLRKGGMPENFEASLFSLGKEEIGEVIQTSIGFHILQVLEIKKIREELEKIREKISKERESELKKEYIENLKQKSIIKILL